MAQVTAWMHAANVKAAWASREKRIAAIQSNRLITIAVLIILSLIEGAAIGMGALTATHWLEVAGTLCIMFNIPLIGRLVYLWYIEYRREEDIREQANRRR